MKTPSTTEIKESVLKRYRTALPDAQLEDSTPLGMLINADTKVLLDFIENYVFVLNQYNIESSTGKYLDALAGNFGLTRLQNTYSIVPVTFYGPKDQLIPAGTVVSSINNDEFVTEQEDIITSTGAVTISCRATKPGNIAVQVNTVNKLLSALPNAISVNNTVSGTEGTSLESDPAFRRRLKRERARFTNGSLKSIQSHISEVPGVQLTKVVENPTDTSVEIQGYTLKPYSIFACVLGGSNKAVAQALFNTKAPGVQYNGTIEQVINDGEVNYIVKFDRPKQIDTFIKLVIESAGSQYSLEQIKEAVLEYYTDNLNIGSPLNQLKLLKSLYTALPEASFSSVELSLDGKVFDTAEKQCKLNELFIIEPTKIEVSFI